MKSLDLTFTLPQLQHLIEDAVVDLCPPKCEWGHEINLLETLEAKDVGEFLSEWVSDHPEVIKAT